MIPSVIVFLMVWNSFYWFQIYKPIAMYWRIIKDSIGDTSYFLFLTGIIMIAFSSALLSLDIQLQSMYDAKIEPVYDPNAEGQFVPLTGTNQSGQFIISLFWQYLLMLGEFVTFDSSWQEYPWPTWAALLVWTYFVLATLILQVIFFNTLVSVIGNHYEARYDIKEKYALQQRNLIFQDFIQSLNVKPMNNYLFHVKPQEETELEDVHNLMIDQLKEHQEEVRQTTEQNFAEMNTKIETLQNKLVQMQQTQNHKQDKLIAMFEEFQAQQKAQN